MLQALELSGFKSFADKTRIECPEGVTVIVGPNGSGKSNVVDAIKWVLGSQSAKALRGSEMTDVIFNGSTSRRPLNAAEVTLEFDNRGGLFDAAGVLQAGTPEVRITRRVLRSGESEYLLNGTTCRLRDLRQLLAGTGMGGTATDSYSIIEQGRVDALLQASPKDRRGLFEEAAGISRFRLKKQEAARRLARVDQNLLRLSDIVDEVEGRLRRVRNQAGKAKKYREHSDRVKQLRTELALADWRGLTTQIDHHAAQITVLSERYEQAQQSLVQCETALSEHQQQVDDGVEQLAAVEERLAQVREQIAGRQAIVTTETNRLVELEEERLHLRRQRVAAQVDAGQREEPTTDDLVERITQAQEELHHAREAMEQLLAEQESAEQILDTLRNQRQALREQRQQLEPRLSGLKQQVESLSTKRQTASLQVNRLASQAQELLPQLEQTEQQLVASEQAAATGQERQQQLAVVLKQTRETVEQRRQELTQQQKQLAIDEADLLRATHQAELLDELEDRLERLSIDIRQMLHDPATGQPATTVRGLVADLLNVDYDTAPLIEAALGERAHHLVVDSGEQFIAAMLAKGTALSVRASFQRLDATLVASAVDRVDLSGERGVMGRADQFVEADERYQGLVRRLLGRTWFVDSFATAMRLASGSGAGLSYVTFQGEVLTSGGELIVGPREDAAGLITRRKESETIREQIELLTSRIAPSREAIVQLEAAVTAASEQEQRAFAEHAEQSEKLASARQEIATLQERVTHWSERAEQSERERLQAERQVAECDQQRQALATEIDQLTSLLQSCEAELSQHASQTSASETQAAQRRNSATQQQVVLAKAEQRLEILTAQQEQSQRDHVERLQVHDDTDRRLEENAQRIVTSELQLLTARGDLALLFIARDEIISQRRLAERQRRGSQSTRSKLSQRTTALRNEMDRMATERQQSQLTLNQFELQRSTLSDRLRDDYAIDLAQAALRMPEDVTITDEERPTLERELEQLRNQVNAVGPVNLESLEELDELESRFEQLSSQYKDLSDAKAALERLTSRINVDSRQLFLATIEAVREHFRELFRRLFGGGEADIVLLDDESDDILECGIDIAAQPPGKELRSISLLSGGEKTMTCVALLLAIFRTKPSPFCVLDEVDAALDEANIGRFTGVLGEFLSSTQFIVITHSKKTMTGANTMYGITMQESGVSKQVSVRFEDVAEDGHIRPTAMLRSGDSGGDVSERRAA